MKPLVSILIPAFNAEKWIAATLESAIGQTWPRKEVIVVDDGSTDRTLAIANSFQSRDVKVVGQPHRNAAAARNNALSHSHGGYIQWLDADDLLAADKVEQQMLVLGALPGNRVLLSSAWARFMYRRSRARFVPTALWQDLAPAEWLVRKMNENIFMQTATWLVSRELTDAAGPWDTRISVDDDGEYFSRVLLLSEGVRFVPDARVFYRFSNGRSLSHIGRSHDKMDSQFRSMQLQISYLRLLEDDQRARAACVRYLQNGLEHFFPERPDLVRDAEQMAIDLGGQLHVPRLGWKYSLIAALLGRRLTRRAQIVLPRIRWSLAELWDKALLPFEADPPNGPVPPAVSPSRVLSNLTESSDPKGFDARRR